MQGLNACILALIRLNTFPLGHMFMLQKLHHTMESLKTFLTLGVEAPHLAADVPKVCCTCNCSIHRNCTVVPTRPCAATSADALLYLIGSATERGFQKLPCWAWCPRVMQTSWSWVVPHMARLSPRSLYAGLMHASVAHIAHAVQTIEAVEAKKAEYAALKEKAAATGEDEEELAEEEPEEAPEPAPVPPSEPEPEPASTNGFGPSEAVAPATQGAWAARSAGKAAAAAAAAGKRTMPAPNAAGTPVGVSLQVSGDGISLRLQLA